MKTLRSSTGRIAGHTLRLVGLGLALTAICAAGAPVASADAPDAKVSPQKPLVTASGVENQDGTVTVTVTGAWNWPSHNSDCNTDRAGAGVAVAWFDPQQAGNLVGTVSLGGAPTAIEVGAAAANALNPADNVVHPTENDTGSGAVADIATPADFASWRGGCGTYANDTNLSGNLELMNHGNLGRVAPGAIDRDGNAFDDPVAPASTALQGAALTHTYASWADVSKVCVVTYDVHKGTAPSANNGVGIPSKASEVQAGDTGHNKDNGVEGNTNTPLGNACPEVVVSHPAISVVKTPKTQEAYPGDTLSFSYAVTNTGNVALLASSVTDDKCSPVTGPTYEFGVTDDNELDVGETWNYSCSYSAPDVPGGTEIVNTVTATFTTAQLQQVTATDTAKATILARILPDPAIAIAKAGPAEATQGDLVTYTLTVTDPGPTSFPADTVIVTDQLCQAPPALQSKNGDATPDSLDPGDSWTYTCAVQTVTGQTQVVNTAGVTGTDTNGKPASATAGATTSLKSGGTNPDVAGAGIARLRGTVGCARLSRAAAAVSGQRIASVTFYMDGKKAKAMTKPNVGSDYVMTARVKGMAYGKHTVTAKVRFTAKSTPSSKSLSLTFSRCKPRVVKPKFTG